MQERQQRVPFTRPVFISPIEGPGRAHRLLTGNISEGGLFVRSEARFDPGTPVSVSLEARGQVLPFARGEVVWDAEAEELPTLGGLPGFGLKFTEFLNDGSPGLINHLVHRSPGANVTEELASQLGSDAPKPPADFMSTPLDKLSSPEPEVEWPIEIEMSAEERPSLQVDLDTERADAAPAAHSVSPDQVKRVAVGVAVGIGVLIVAAVLLMRTSNSTPAEEPQQFPALDLTATPAAAPALVTPTEAAITSPQQTAQPVVPPQPAAAAVTKPEPVRVKQAPAPVSSLALNSGAVKTLQASTDGRTLDVSLSLAPGARVERVFTLTSPSRLVIDLTGAAPRASLRRDVDLPEVKDVRVGARSGGTRLVLDLKREAAKVVDTRSGARVTLK
jgi:AMIN domain/PilZ domain